MLMVCQSYLYLLIYLRLAFNYRHYDRNDKNRYKILDFTYNKQYVFNLKVLFKALIKKIQTLAD